MTARRTPAEVDTEDEGQPDAGVWDGYRFGDPISLADVLALDAPGRLDRDDEGRLCMAPDDARIQRFPLSCLQTHLIRTLDPRFFLIQEPGLSLLRLIHLAGHTVPPSSLGIQTVEPDIAVFDGRPRLVVPASGRGRTAFATVGLALVVEIVSPSTFRQDLGLGRADELDRWASYLASGVPELWVLNVGVESPCPLPAGAGLFLSNRGDRWESLPVDGAVNAEGDIHGVRPLTAGRVVSRSTGLTLDLVSLWPMLTLPE